MKIAFVYPRFDKFRDSHPELRRELDSFFLGDFTTPPSLGIPILASLAPDDAEIRLIDDNAGDPLDTAAETDLVAINCFTPQAERAFEIADAFRAAGRKVVIGGMFPSFMADECLKHADSVNTGEGEPTWPLILEDAKNGRLKPVYNGGNRFDLSKMRPPRRDIFYSKTHYDWDEDLVQISRGCPYQCAMCAIPAHMGGRIRLRPVGHVAAEIAALKHENVYLADDTLFLPQRNLREYARSLLEALKPTGKKFFVSSTMALNTDPDFLDLLAAAGVKNFYCTLNVDPASIRAVAGEAREREDLKRLVADLGERGIRFFASFAVGRDWDDESIAERILNLVDYADIHTAEFFIFTPYPGSVHMARLESQGRIIDRSWRRYNGAHVVFKPHKMPPDKLRELFVTLWLEFYRRQSARHTANLEPATWKRGAQVVGKPLERRGARGQAAITGLGVISPIGNDPASMLDALRRARHAIKPITRFDASHFRTNLGAEISDEPLARLLSEEERAEYEDRYLQMAIAAARMALADAEIPPCPDKPRRDIALVLATCNGGLLSAEEEYRWLNGLSSRAFDEKMNLMAQFYGFGKALSSALGMGGEAWIVTTACSSSTAALGLAESLIRRGRGRIVLVGASDALCLSNTSGFSGLKAMAAGQTAPFSLPMGMNVGEGACFWVVENMEQALLRNARILGKILGHATTCDAHHPTTPEPRGDGAYRTLRNALSDAGVSAAQLGCINAHGTGTEANDKAESRGMRKLFGDQPPVPVVSTKSFFGHCMGATGLLEATGNLLAMNAGFIPPTVNFSEPRPGCSLDYAPNTPREKKYDVFASANYAFGGNNAAAIVAAPGFNAPARAGNEARVAITAAGLVTSLGLGADKLIEALRASRTGMTTVERLNVKETRALTAGLVPDFQAPDVDRRLDFSELNLISRYAAAAASMALASASFKVSPKNAEQVGIVMGVSNGSSESDHMNSVFSSPSHEADLRCFSSITPNSTAGWTAKQLCIKGVNITLSPGPHAALQAMAFAFDSLQDNRARAVLAGGADEIYPQMFWNYDRIGFLYSGERESRYRIRLDEPRAKVIGEGAAMLLLETAESAAERGVAPLAEMLGYGMSMDADGFSAQSMNPDGLEHAALTACARAGVDMADIDLVVWAPQGNAQDGKTLAALERLSPGRAVPLAATSMNTGYIETASIAVGLAAALHALRLDGALWPQITGLADVDARPFESRTGLVMALASTDLGYNFAAIFNTKTANGRD